MSHCRDSRSEFRDAKPRLQNACCRFFVSVASCAKNHRNWSAFIETVVKWKRVTIFGPQCIWWNIYMKDLPESAPGVLSVTGFQRWLCDIDLIHASIVNGRKTKLQIIIWKFVSSLASHPRRFTHSCRFLVIIPAAILSVSRWGFLCSQYTT